VSLILNRRVLAEQFLQLGWRDFHAYFIGEMDRGGGYESGWLPLKKRAAIAAAPLDLLPYTVHEITAFAIDFARHEAVHIGLEAREFLVEIPRKFQVIDDRAIETLARNQ
jgi:hypothetical protein